MNFKFFIKPSQYEAGAADACPTPFILHQRIVGVAVILGSQVQTDTPVDHKDPYNRRF